MRKWSRMLLPLIAVAIVTGCAPGKAPTAAETSAAPAAPTGPKRLVVGVQTEINSLASRMVRSGAGTRPGMTEIEQLANAGLTQLDSNNALAPELAEAVPSTTNGLWKVFPDGRMETTWKVREGAAWHDGTPLTADDLIFTVNVGRDADLPLLRNTSLALVESASAPDARTFVITWKQPFIDADSTFAATTGVQHLPLPKHILEGPLGENKAAYETLPYWSSEFVGLGPFRLQEWALGQSVILRANDHFVGGRPKIDEIELRSYPDPNVLEAAMLSEAVDLPLGTSRSTSFDMAQDLQARWSGKVYFTPGNVLSFWPQLLVGAPPIIGETRFRKALVLGLNRQEMVNAFYAGNTAVADTFVGPDDPDAAELKPSAVHYDFDPRQAVSMIQALGYTQGSDGIFVDARGERLAMDLHSGPTDILMKAKLSAASQWQQVGVAVTPINDSDAQRADVKYRGTMTGFDTARFGAGTTSFNFRNFKISEARLPERGYVGLNTTGYMNQELDEQIDRYYVTIPRAERVQIASQIVHHLSDQVVPLLLFYDVTSTAIGSRVRNVSWQGNELWNAVGWDVS